MAHSNYIEGIKGCLGLFGYYRKFGVGYAKIVCPLMVQLKKDSFGWSEDAEKAFETVKLSLKQAPILAMSNFQRPL